VSNVLLAVVSSEQCTAVAYCWQWSAVSSGLLSVVSSEQCTAGSGQQ